MKVLFVAGFGPIVSDMQGSTAFYRESLGLSFQEEADQYFHTEGLQVVNSVKSGSYTLSVKLACCCHIDRSFYINKILL